MRRRCILGIDPGERWLGVARAAGDNRLAFPLGSIDLSDAAIEPAAAVRGLLDGDEVTTVVVGVPVRADGAEDEQAARFRRFGEALAAQLGAECRPQSERHSSLDDTAPVAPPMRGKQRRKQRLTPAQRQRERRESHARAAARILQRWLDAQLAAAWQSDMPSEAP